MRIKFCLSLVNLLSKVFIQMPKNSLKEQVVWLFMYFLANKFRTFGGIQSMIDFHCNISLGNKLMD